MKLFNRIIKIISIFDVLNIYRINKKIKLNRKMYILYLTNIYEDSNKIQDNWRKIIYTLFEGWASIRRSNQIEKEKVILGEVCSRH